MARKIAGLTLLMLGATLYCMAGVAVAPEIDPAGGAAAVALLGGGLLIIRSRRGR
jgi:hypothetical protein